MRIEPSDAGNPPESRGLSPSASQSQVSPGRKRLVLGVGGALLVGIGCGSVWAASSLQRQLGPLVERNLADFLNRPVKLGSVQFLTWGNIRFGASEILATPTDPGRVSLEALEVSFNPLQFLLARELSLDVRAIEPEIYLEQGKGGSWLLTPFDSLDRHWIRLERLRVQDARASLAARSRGGKGQPAVKIWLSSGKAEFTRGKQGREVDFQGTGRLVEGGQFELAGVGRPQVEELALALRGQDLPAAAVGRLLPLPLHLQGGEIDANLEVKLKAGQLPQLRGLANLQEVKAQVTGLPQPFSGSHGLLRFRGTEVRLEGVRGHFGPIAGRAEGRIDWRRGYALKAQTEPTAIGRVREALKLKALPVAISGQLKAAVEVAGELNHPQLGLEVVAAGPVQVGSLDFQSVQAELTLKDRHLSIRDFSALPALGGHLGGRGTVAIRGPASGNSLAASTFELNLEARDVPGQVLERLSQQPLPIEVEALSARGQVSGRLDRLEALRGSGSASFQLPGGTVTADRLEYRGGAWQASLKATDLPLASLNVPWPSSQGRVQGRVQVSSPVPAFQPETLRAAGSARISLPDGSVAANHLQLAGGRWQAKLQVEGWRWKTPGPAFPGGGTLRANLEVSGPLEAPLSQLQGQGTASLNLGRGQIAATQVRVSGGKFAATLVPREVPLALLSPHWQGELGGEVQVAGDWRRLKPEEVEARGRLSFSQGLAGFRRPLTAALDWNGGRLEIREAIGPGLQARGWADLDLAAFQRPENWRQGIRNFELAVAAEGLPLKALPLPSQLAGANTGGQVDFAGTVAGSGSVPKVEGQVALRHLRLEPLAFEPLLAGTLQGSPRDGVHLQLAGRNDRLSLQLGRQFQPASFDLQLQGMHVRGARQGGEWRLAARQVPLNWLQDLARKPLESLPAFFSQPAAGELSGNFAFNPQTVTLSGREVAIAHPRLGNLTGDRWTGNFDYAGGHLTLRDSLFQRQGSRYHLDGSLVQGPAGPRLRVQMAVAGGQIQDVLETLQIFELSDLPGGPASPVSRRAADLSPLPPNERGPLLEAGLPEASLKEQLSRLSQIDGRLQERRRQRQSASPLPPLRELQGSFQGQVALTASRATGLQAEFDLQGRAWEWGKFHLDRLQVRGNFEEGILTFAPFSLSAEDSRVTLTGSIGGRAQSAQLQVTDLPLEPLGELLALPPLLNLGGVLDATVTVGGNRNNPYARGQVTVNSASLNQLPLKATAGNFNYRNGRCHFSVSSVVARQTEPLRLEGTFPYRLPFATVMPDSDRLALSLNVKNDSLRLVNFLTAGQVGWVGGEGEVKLDVAGRIDLLRGQLKELSADGTATFDRGTVSSQLFPDTPLTQVSGRIRFDLDRLEVEGLTAKLSGGEVSAAGSLPLLAPTPQADPLRIDLNHLALNLKERYRGGAGGYLQVTGSLLEPHLGGQVELFEGEISLPDRWQGSPVGGALAGATQLSGLQLILGEGIDIVRPPLLSFSAGGSLTLNGPLSQLRPEGTLALRSGQVNLLASQLRLAGGEDHRVQFFPHRGLDPYLDLRLVATANEAARRVRSNPLSSEVNEPFSASADSLQAIRIQARVQGFASQLSDSIELSSSPQRNPQEIVALLGGSWTDSFNRGDPTLGLANLAGAAVSGTLQGAIGESLGLSEFRIFPTQLLDETERTGSTEIGVAAEAGVELMDNLSFSVLKIVNSERPPQFGIRYRLNENTRLRGWSDFAGESRGTIEYERRF